MKEIVESLRRRYESFKKGEENVLAFRDEVHLILEQARKRDNKAVETLEDMLLDLEFSIEESKCKCHRKHST